MSKINKTFASGLVVAGVGIGSATTPVTERTEYLAAPAPKTIEVPVRFEEAHHNVDESIRVALKLNDGATNQDLIDIVTELAIQNETLSSENKRIIKVLNKKKSAVKDYYRENGG